MTKSDKPHKKVTIISPEALAEPGQAGQAGEVQEVQEMQSVTYWSGSHTLHRLRFHLVWIPKYRKRVLEGAIAVRLRALFVQACSVNDWGLHELNIQPDHVHLLLQISPRDSVAKVVNRLKGGSSRVLRAEFLELEEFLWGDSFWAEGYFAESVGQIEEGVVRRYIRNQAHPDQSQGKDVGDAGNESA